ncbi:MAG TPA: YggT family protein [Acidobacteriota bacterium]|nr:YggT family protein [Acidobacteriota bacterium]
MQFVITAIYIVAVAMFWLLVFRAVAAALKLNPYNPSIQFLFRITEPLVHPFRGLRRGPSRIDPAVFPPMGILALIILYFLYRIWWV